MANDSTNYRDADSDGHPVEVVDGGESDYTSDMARIISLSVILTLIVVLGITFFRVVAPFLLPLFLAGVLAILVQPLFRYFRQRTGERLRLAAGLTTATVLMSMLLPVVVATLMGTLQLYAFALDFSSSGEWDRFFSKVQEISTDKSETYVEWIVESINHYRPADQAITAEDLKLAIRTKTRSYFEDLGDRSLGVAGKSIVLPAFDVVTALIFSAAQAALGLMMFTVALYYFLADGTALITATERLIPVHVDYQRELLNEFAKVVRSVVVATFLAALAQSVATVLALWFLGFPHLLVLFILCFFASMIPLAGTWLVWIPCATILAIQGHWASAVFLSLYGAAFVGMIDNIVRTYILNTDTKLHPLLAFVSVLGGLQVLGLWGVFIGPIAASCLHALVKIFNHELAVLSRAAFAAKRRETSNTEEEDEASGRTSLLRELIKSPTSTSQAPPITDVAKQSTATPEASASELTSPADPAANKSTPKPDSAPKTSPPAKKRPKRR
ncbi:MAG: AI-2E family transporter [Planctomycetaceae bacterium]